MNRRRFLTQAAALGSGLYVSSLLPALAAPQRRLEGIGLQLYTVHGPMSEDFEGTLRAVADMGCREVEFSTVGGLYGREPHAVQGQLKQLGLRAPFGRLRPQIPDNVDIASLPRDEAIKLFFQLSGTDRILDNLRAMLPEAAVMGYESIVLSAVSPADMKDRAALARLVDIFNEAGALCASHGMTFAYHNHDFDFTPVDGMLPFDYLLTNTDPDSVQFQFDLYWVSKAGQDPLRYFRDHGKRFNSCHMKDMAVDGTFADVGAGTLNFPVLTAAALDAGVRHFFVEHDAPQQPLASAESSYAFLASMTF